MTQGTPSASPPPRVPADSIYVALGSSFASGPGIDPIIDAACSRSGANYPHLVAATHDLQLADVTCGGATVNDLLAVGRLGRPPQIDAVASDAKLVTVTVGGNDIQYVSQLIRTAYQNEPMALEEALVDIPKGTQNLIRPVLCAPVTDEDRRATRAALDGLPARLVEAIREIRRRAPDSRILVVDYLTVLPRVAGECSSLPLSVEQAMYFLDIASQLNVATKLAAEQGGAELVEASKASRDHHACAASPWVFGFEFGDILAGGAKAFHPNGRGMAAVADLVTNRIR